MGGAAVAVAALGYYYYSSQSTDPQDDEADTSSMDYGSKIEQITYDGDNNLNPIEEQPKAAETANSFDENERKSYDAIEEEPAQEEEQEPDDVPIVDAMAADSKPAEETAPAEETKEVEQVEETQPVEADPVAETETESKEPPSEAKKAKEDSPVMVEVEPTEQQREEARLAAEEAKRKEAIERELNSRLQRYEKVAERAAKCPTLKYKNGKLKIKVLRATNVDKKDLGKSDFSDVFVKMEVPGCHFQQTTIQKDAVNPVWNEAFELKVRDLYKDALKFTLMDHDTMVNDTIGEVQVPIIQVVAAQDSAVKNKGFRVKGSKTGCMLFVDVQYVEEPGKKKK